MKQLTFNKYSLPRIVVSILLAGTILFACPFAEAQTTEPDSDFQVWSETTLAFRVAKAEDKAGVYDRLTLLFMGTLRLGQNRLYPVDDRIGVGFEVKPSRAFTLTPSYIYRRGETFRGMSDYEHRVRFDVTYEKKWKAFSIKERNRVEYRIRNSRPDSARYRNRFTFYVPVKQKDKELFAPFVQTEPFYDFTEKKWNSNEFSVGIRKKFSDVLSGEFFYLLKNNRGSAIKQINAVGVNLKFHIN